MPDLIDRLKSIAARWEGGGGLCERDDILEAVAEMERQAQTIAELRAVVEKLPKYADNGQPILTGNKGFIRSDKTSWLGESPLWERYDDDDNLLVTVVRVTVWNRNPDHTCATLDGAEECDYFDGPIYSTEEAALAAKEQEPRHE